MNPRSIRIVFALATAMLAATGLVGGVIPVYPVLGTEKYRGHAVAYSEKARRYIAVAAAGGGTSPAGGYSPRANGIAPPAGRGFPAITGFQNPQTDAKPSL